MEDFVKTQQSFVAQLREAEPAELDYPIEARRLKIYRELFFNNINGFLSTGFPVLKSLYTDSQWLALVRTFFAFHHCRSPYFVDISKEFVEFLSQSYELTPDDPACMRELAHYEWLELDVSIRKTTQTAVVWNGDAVPDRVYLSELVSLVSYPYPVHQVKPDFIPQEAGEPVFLLVYRDDVDEVNFLEVNGVTAHLIQLCEQQQEQGIKLTDLVGEMTRALPQLPTEQVEGATIDTVRQLLQQQILLIGED